MRIIFLSENPLPANNASASRMSALLRGLSEWGNECSFINYDSHYSRSEKHEYCTIKINYIGIRFFSNIFRNRLFFKFDTIISLMVIFLKIPVSTDFILITSGNLLIDFLIMILNKIKKVPVIYFCSETPELYYHNKISRFIFYRTVHNFSGAVLITDKLKDYFEEKVRIQSVKIGLTVEDDKNFIVNDSQNNNDTQFLFFMGSTCNNKDGYIFMVDVFNKLQRKYPNLRLYVVSSSPKKEIVNLKNFNKEKTIIKSNLERSELFYYLNQAIICCLPRPLNIQNTYGFPTKLGDYLLSKPPLITSRTSEIDRYLTHRHDSYLFEPDNQTEFEKGIIVLLEDRELREKISKNAKLTVKNYFSFRKQGDKLNIFLKELLGNRV